MNTVEKKPERRSPLPVSVLVILAILIIAWILPLPALKAQTSYSYKSRPQPVNLDWPSYGEAAVGAEGYGLLDSHGAQVAQPIASCTKMITALAVLKKHPLSAGNQGPTITITSDDVSAYNNYVAQDGSVVAVSAGEQLSEYQALQAMLLPSANNMAFTLARWGWGSMNSYVNYANKYLGQLGLKNTHVADASGFSPQSVSTASDLTSLGLIVMSNPVLSGIVGQSSADLPVAGTVKNTNWLLGSNGINGIKTGNTEQAGGCYLFSASRDIDGQKILVVGAVMGADNLTAAMSDSRDLLLSVDNGFTKVTVAKKNEILGIYAASWGSVVNLVAKNDVNVVTWQTRQVSSKLDISNKMVTVKRGQKVGTISAVVWGKKNNVDVVADDNVPGPAWQWRLYRRHL
ncbi:MAG TPA: hypothetical protein VFP35_02815 [Candidatus Saccharimonadales bacterium]|nr:hypothetical protein [Candidatus Saccharimonadales bacterium]